MQPIRSRDEKRMHTMIFYWHASGLLSPFDSSCRDVEEVTFVNEEIILAHEKSSDPMSLFVSSMQPPKF
jgi:hypothetical protein